MKKSNNLNEFKKIIDEKQLVKIFFGHNDTYYVSYILNANEKYITIANVSPTGDFQGVDINLFDNIDKIETKTDYLNEMNKHIDKSAYKQALKKTENINTFSFEGFVSAYLNTKTLMEVEVNNCANLLGRVSVVGESVLIFDEYSLGIDHRTSHTIVHPSNITTISIGTESLATLSQYLESINI